MVDDKTEQLIEFSRLFELEGIPVITKVIDDGALNNLDLDNLDAIYQVFRERFSVTITFEDSSKRKWFSLNDFIVTDSNNDPLLVLKFFSDKGISIAAQDMEEDLTRRLDHGPIEEYKYLWKMNYCTYLDDYALNSILKSVSERKKGFLKRNYPKRFNDLQDQNLFKKENFDDKIEQLSRLKQLFKSGIISGITKVIDNGTLNNLDLDSLKAIYQVFRERFNESTDTRYEIIMFSNLIFDSTNDVFYIVKFFLDKGNSLAATDMKQEITVKLNYGSMKECVCLWKKNYFAYLDRDALSRIGLQRFELITNLMNFNELEDKNLFKKKFANYLKELLNRSLSKFIKISYNVLPLIRAAKDQPELVAIIKDEVLKDEIDEVKKFQKIEEIPGEVFYFSEDPETVDYMPALEAEYALRYTINKSRILKMYYYYDEIYVAGVETAREAADKILYDNDEIRWILKGKDILDQDLINSERIGISEYVPIEGIDQQILKALIYLELKRDFTTRLRFKLLREEDFEQKFSEFEFNEENMYEEDMRKTLIDPDYEKEKEYENDIVGGLPYTNEELAEIFEELNEDKDENRKKRNL